MAPPLQRTFLCRIILHMIPMRSSHSMLRQHPRSQAWAALQVMRDEHSHAGMGVPWSNKRMGVPWSNKRMGVLWSNKRMGVPWSNKRSDPFKARGQKST